jgi:hypothetical protein
LFSEHSSPSGRTPSLLVCQELLSRAEDRTAVAESALREARKEKDEKVSLKARELDVQEAHFVGELVSRVGLEPRGRA